MQYHGIFEHNDAEFRLFIFLQAISHGLRMRGEAKLMGAIACSTVPKITVIVGNSFGMGNYLMVSEILQF